MPSNIKSPRKLVLDKKVLAFLLQGSCFQSSKSLCHWLIKLRTYQYKLPLFIMLRLKWLIYSYIKQFWLQLVVAMVTLWLLWKYLKNTKSEHGTVRTVWNMYENSFINVYWICHAFEADRDSLYTKHKYFSFPGHQLPKNMVFVFGSYERTKKG